jgi:hypothetical protein
MTIRLSGLIARIARARVRRGARTCDRLGQRGGSLRPRRSSSGRTTGSRTTPWSSLEPRPSSVGSRTRHRPRRVGAHDEVPAEPAADRRQVGSEAADLRDRDIPFVLIQAREDLFVHGGSVGRRPRSPTLQPKHGKQSRTRRGSHGRRRRAHGASKREALRYTGGVSTKRNDHNADEPLDLERSEARARMNRAAIELLDRWLADESGYDEAVWPIAKQAIEENHTGPRQVFGE